MSKTVTKVAVSIPSDLYEQMEHTRQSAGQSRSAAVQEALRHWLRERLQREAVGAYVKGYRHQPETPDEIEAAEAAATQLLATQEWE
jgi:metal-responsive CopG/Arc/MetJ family transcriptional regulator